MAADPLLRPPRGGGGRAARGIACAVALALGLASLDRALDSPTSRPEFAEEAEEEQEQEPEEEENSMEEEAPREFWGEPHRPRRMVHAFNLYDSRDRGGAFSPLGYEQWIMLSSVDSARGHFRERVAERKSDIEVGEKSFLAFDFVSIVCAVLDHDLEALAEIVSKYCDHVSVLDRSTATSYPSLEMKPLPFVQDIFDAGISFADGLKAREDDEYYVMYTNSDISATLEFYSWTESYIRGREAQFRARGFPRDLLGLTVNRMTLDFERLPSELADMEHGVESERTAARDSSSLESKDAAAAEFTEKARKAVKDGLGRAHPGHDCFVLRPSVAKSFDFGELFIGYPPLGSVRQVMTVVLGEKQAPAVESHRWGTFHIGDERSWTHHSAGDKNVRSWVERNPGKEDELKNVLYCPHTQMYSSNLYHLQNTINCGKIFRSRLASDLGGSREEGVAEDRRVPSFVREGHEGLYRKYGVEMLHYEEDGIPVWRGQSLASGEKKMSRLEVIWNLVGGGGRASWARRRTMRRRRK